jgi:cyclomaltodextrinase / maltogenic alpha-amylase / neopullulanase
VYLPVGIILKEIGMHNWSEEAVFYHIYPLGYCGAPERNEGPASAAPEPRLRKVEEGLDAMAGLGVNALYLGPLFESVAHGYDTVDYRNVDRRLGLNEDLASLSHAAKARGMRVVLDGVFNHVGRKHP